MGRGQRSRGGWRSWGEGGGHGRGGGHREGVEVQGGVEVMWRGQRSQGEGEGHGEGVEVTRRGWRSCRGVEIMGRGGGQGVEVTGRGGGHREGWRSWGGVEVMERRQRSQGGAEVTGRGRGHGVEVTGSGQRSRGGVGGHGGRGGQGERTEIEREADETRLCSGLAEARAGSPWAPSPSSVPPWPQAPSFYVSRALMPLAAWQTLDPRGTFWAGPRAPPAWPCLGLLDRGPEAPCRQRPAPAVGSPLGNLGAPA